MVPAAGRRGGSGVPPGRAATNPGPELAQDLAAPILVGRIAVADPLAALVHRGERADACKQRLAQCLTPSRSERPIGSSMKSSPGRRSPQTQGSRGPGSVPADCVISSSWATIAVSSTSRASSICATVGHGSSRRSVRPGARSASLSLLPWALKSGLAAVGEAGHFNAPLYTREVSRPSVPHGLSD